MSHSKGRVAAGNGAGRAAAIVRGDRGVGNSKRPCVCELSRLYKRCRPEARSGLRTLSANGNRKRPPRAPIEPPNCVLA